MPKSQKKDQQSSQINKYLQPFEYQKWKIIGGLLEQRQNVILKPKINSFTNFVYRFARNFGGLMGFFIIIFLIVLALVLPLTTNDPYKINIDNPYLPLFSDNAFFGTDQLGRDFWARLWYGLRFSLTIAFMATLIDLVIGFLIGIVMGYIERLDVILQFIIKVITNIPTIIIMIIAMIIFTPSLWVFVLSLSLTGWIGMAQQVRAQVKRAKNFEWVNASRILGTPKWKIVLNFLPVTIPIVITQLVFTIPGAILSETALAFIGLAIPNEATLGVLITDGSQLITLYPRFTIIPASLLVLLTTSIQLIGNATQGALRRQR